MQSLLQKSTASRGQVVVRAEKKGFSFSLPTTTKKVAAGTKPTPKSTGTTRSGGVGYRKYQGDALWLPNTARPQWLDGSLPGDRGFDPLGLSRPSDFVQIALDGNDQNKAVNLKGTPEGSIGSVADELTQNSFQPYSEVFGLQRFRECELIHGRWAMLACLGAVVAEATTGVSWAEAGKVELDGASYAGFSLPFSITQLVWIEVLAVGGAEIYRNGALEPERRCYPGGVFDPLGLASGDDERAFRLKTAEIKHGRLAMIGFLGYGVQALSTGEGALGSLAKFTDSLAASS